MSSLIGVFGGTFDPIHNGHLLVIKQLLLELNFSEIKLIPCKLPVHKDPAHANPDQRYAMLKLVCEEVSKITIDTQELKRHSHSYMLETLQSLRKDFPEQSLALIIGADNFVTLHTWRFWQSLIDYAHIIVIARPGVALTWNSEVKKFLKKFETDNKLELYEKKFGKLFFSLIETLHISSSELRKKIKNHEDVDFLLPKKVIEYISQEKLYL